MKLEKRPATVEAFEYKGGAKSAKKLAVWLRKRFPHNTVVWVPPIFDDGKAVVEDEVRIFSHVDRHKVNVVFPGRFVVLSEDRGLYVVSKESLFFDFKEVPDADAQS